MRVEVAFQNERLELDVADDRLLGHWAGPRCESGPARDVRRLVLDALESPRDYPPLRQAVVPGDRVVIACSEDLPDARPVLQAITEVLQAAGVEAGDITVLVAEGSAPALAEALPPGLTLIRHDPTDRTSIAYLASTESGRRVYLNRALVDADFVFPVGSVSFDPILGARGPWGVVFPALSNQESQRALRVELARAPAGSETAPLDPDEALAINWLLGSQLQLGLVPDLTGVASATAGLGPTVRAATVRTVEGLWSFEAASRAELVVVGIGMPGRPSRIGDLARGLATATQLVARGGKIVAFSRAEGPLGPAFRRFMALGESPPRASVLRGHEADRDFSEALQLAQTLEWADVYLLSALGSDLVDDLGMIVLDRPEEARRVVAASRSCHIVSHADRVRAVVAED